MKTTEQWWSDVSSDPEKMIDWLKSQYRGEVHAAERIEAMANSVGPSHRQRAVLNRIANDEFNHSLWILDLLLARGIDPDLNNREDRYWKETLPEGMEALTFQELCAVGHLAEVMRLDRIRLLASDERFADIAEVFQRILPDEEFHARAFGVMSTPELIEAARANHDNGCNALGLVA